jgi:putative transposase
VSVLPDELARLGENTTLALLHVRSKELHRAGGVEESAVVCFQDGEASPPQRRVGDITYIFTWEGWLYLATVIDCATRMVVGWAMDDNYKTPLITSAIKMAARNVELPTGAVFHSDRGSNYTSAEFAAELESLGIRQSVGRTGICYDNSLAESFNGTLKVERVHRTVYATRRKAREDIARYIELRYNRKRLHSAIGYRTPQEAMDEYREMKATA